MEFLSFYNEYILDRFKQWERADAVPSSDNPQSVEGVSTSSRKRSFMAQAGIIISDYNQLQCTLDDEHQKYWGMIKHLTRVSSIKL
jgi:hypothetical protein